MPRSPSPTDLLGTIDRHKEEIRQLRLRHAGDGPPAGWTSLIPYLTPAWGAMGAYATTGSTPGDGFSDINDMTKPTWPRYYIDRGRVYLGGSVRFDLATWTTYSTLPGGYQKDVIYATAPFEPDFGRPKVLFMEDLEYSATGTTPQIGFALGSTLRIGGSGTGGSLPDKLVLPLDQISYRIG